MEFQTQLENHEQRIRLSSSGILQAVMPGEQPLEDGEHIIGHLPVGALIDGWQAWMPPTGDFGGDITVSLGIPGNTTLFFDNVVIATGNPSGSAIHNWNDLPVEEFISNEPLIATISAPTKNANGLVAFNVSYSEIDTKAGKYTH